MRKVGVSLLAVIFLFTLWVVPVMADTAQDVEKLKGEVQNLLKKIEQMEKKQDEAQTKAAETETKVEKVAKKALKDRIEWGGEARFRFMHENATTPAGFYGVGQPSATQKYRDSTSMPLRIRLNAHAEVVQDWVDFYSRLTINKRWGAFDDTATDPFNKRNSFEASIGHDVSARFEQAYATVKVPYINSLWYIGRLPGEDGAPQRQALTLFPRLFIDSEIDGTLLKWDAPKTGLDDVNLPWTSMRLWGTQSEPGKAPTLKQYEAKVSEKTGIILGYLKYQENKMQLTGDQEVKADSDAFLAQARLKLGKDTTIIWDGLAMSDWHMPQTTVASNVSIPDVKTNYLLTGVYADTQLLGLQVYGAFYYSHFDNPQNVFKTTSGTKTTSTVVEPQGMPGHAWFVGFNTGDLISRDMQFTLEFTDGSDNWINPFNYRGYRRKGTVSSPAGNFFYDATGKTTAGFYPMNAQVWDVYYDWYAWKNVRFRLGYMDFLYTKHEPQDGAKFSVLGSSKFQHDWWPYAELNISF